MNILKWSLLFLIAAMLTYILGPRVEEVILDPYLTDLQLNVENVEDYVRTTEGRVEGLKPDNEARIVWAGEAGQRTPYSFVYIHGFSASPEEGSPVHEALADRYGANLYQARLYGHGIDTEEPLIDATGEKLLASAKEALSIGNALGDSVIVISCSSGSTLALYLAAHHPEIHSLMMYSPNIDFAKPGSDMLTKPWGLELARLMMRSKYRSFEGNEEVQKYWTTKYRLEGLVYLKKLVESTMTPETFAHIHQPFFLAYCYKNELEQDDIVKVSEMLKMYGQTATPSRKKRKRSFPLADSHVILSDITSKDVDGVLKSSFDFCDNILDMRPVATDSVGLE